MNFRPGAPRPRRGGLQQAADEIFTAFSDQVLSFDLRAAAAYADLVADRESTGNPIGGFDARIAAICRTHLATLATRNMADFAGIGIATVNPWQNIG